MEAVLISCDSHGVCAGFGRGYAVGSGQDGALVPAGRGRVGGVEGALAFQRGELGVLGAWGRSEGFGLDTAAPAHDTAQEQRLLVFVLNSGFPGRLADVSTGRACGCWRRGKWLEASCAHLARLWVVERCEDVVRCLLGDQESRGLVLLERR
jgi:hypothetical protein